MSATFLEFKERKLAERLASSSRLPGWVTSVGYVQVAFRAPKIGEYFYGPIRDKVMQCNALETTPFAIVEYMGGK